MAKNPNQQRGIILTMSRVSSIQTPLPCKRLERRIKEFLLLAAVKPTEYKFVLEGTGQNQAANLPAMRVSGKPGSTIDFELQINLPDGEFFKGTLHAPVKCGNDKLTEVFARSAIQISRKGWHPEKETESKVPILPPSTAAQVQNELLIRKIEKWLKDAEAEIAGNKRSVNRLNESIHSLEAKRQEFLRELNLLRK